MGCTPSKNSAPPKPKRAILYGSDTIPSNQRYVPYPAPAHIRFASSTNFGKARSGKKDTIIETYFEDCLSRTQYRTAVVYKLQCIL